MATELGREVPLSDWLSFHRDRLLSVLAQMRRQGIPNPGFRASAISGVTGLPEVKAAELARALVENQWLVDDHGTYRLTDQGFRWVQESPER
jgi:DNA-binding IclR family transcriptional regulator